VEESAESVTEVVCTGEGPDCTGSFRVVDGSTDADIILAKVGGSGDDVYTLAGFDGETTLDGQSTAMIDLVYVPGNIVNITYEGVMETYPGQLAGVSAIDIRTDGFDDRCRLYLDVLEDLWNVDEGLNAEGSYTYIGVDLSETSLSESEQAAVAWRFAGKHGGDLVQGSYEALSEWGYFTEVPLDPADARNYQSDVKHYQWDDGILFTIRETDDPVAFSLPALGVDDAGDGNIDMTQYNVKNTVAFDAEKWRSGTGAYYLTNCTAVQNNDGQWGDYQVGSQAIS
jgi:hypothetical protein